VVEAAKMQNEMNPPRPAAWRSADGGGMTDTTTCSICEGTGWKIVERAGLSGAQRCTCYDAKRDRALKAAAGIPPIFEHATVDNLEIPKDNPAASRVLGNAMLLVKGFIREFPAGDHPGLLLIGDPGAGKTHLAVAAMKALIERGRECVFFDYQNLIDRIRSGWDSNAGTADREAYRTALDTEVLVLDDLGSNRPIDWIMDTLTSIITYRCNHRKPLIATTNHPNHELVGKDKDYARKSLGEVIGQRARSRLHEMCRIADMSGVPDYRLRRAR
jgi:DNA replication protein DnaC